jgi:formate dehydrogenase major subunit
VPGLGTSLGRGGATTAQQDLANADAILIMGSSMAENHPVGFQWVIEAREKNGAKIIHVDPRFNRTSAMADYWLPLRAGSDIIFLGALINYVLTDERYFRDYVVHYTNAPTILRSDFQDSEDLGGLFSGWDGERYDPETWRYAGAMTKGQGHREEGGGHDEDRGGEAQDEDAILRDDTLQHPRCVFQVLKRHFARYTPELVERSCGIPRLRFLEVADVFTRASGPDRTAAICYAVGWTQHSTGVQIIRCAAILQLLLGNIGRPGGGILALRGHASIQGSTDIPTLYDTLPGYLPMPAHSADGESTLTAYLERHQSQKGWWHNIDKYIVSLLKAYYGDAATRENDFGFDWLPRLTGDHSHFGYWLDMADGKLEGLLVMGQNPAVGAPNAKLERKALSKLRWLVVRDLVETETATFWLDSPEAKSGELDPEDVETEVFFFPAASHVEKEGTFTNTQRLLQWREKAVEPPGDARSELQFMVQLGRRLKSMATDAPRDAALRALTWDYADEDGEEVLREIHGWKNDDASCSAGFQPALGRVGAARDGQPVQGRLEAGTTRAPIKHFGELQADGSTTCGCWIYSGVFDGENKANGRAARDAYGHGWGYAWPLDRRILYNRCSAKPDGTPWSERKKLVWWDESQREWTGLDIPDFTKAKRPDAPGSESGKGDEALRGDAPFIMHSDGLGWLWVPSGLKDGPLPVHYEPLESNLANPLHPQQTNPAENWMERPDNAYAGSPDDRFPHVLTTYRLTEHHTAGGMTRTLSHLAELQPELFTEISPELAREVGVGNGDRVSISTARGSIEARALVTNRMPSLDITTANGSRRVHQVGLPYHWGYRGLVTGDVVNDLLAISEEPNVKIFESKALTCRVARAGGS